MTYLSNFAFWNDLLIISMDVKVRRPTFSVRRRVASSIDRLSIKSINKRKILNGGVCMREFGLVRKPMNEEKLRESLPETHLERHLEGSPL